MDLILALGGGGARGNSHIGVLRRLEEEGFNIRAVAGSSFGGIVAAIYAAGYSPQEMEDIFSKVDQSRLYGHTPNDGPSFLGMAGVTRWLDEVLGRRTFDDLKIPCALTAVDLNSADEVILRHGSLKEAVMATIALPGIFPPRNMDGYQLVDGAVVDPVPVSVVRSLLPGLPVAAVVLSSPLGKPSPEMLVPLPRMIPVPLIRRLTRLRIAQAFNIFMRSIEIGGRMLADLRLQLDDPEVIIRPDVAHINLLDQVDVRQVALLGDQAVQAVLPELKHAVSWQSRLGRRLFG